jgi:polysaccharide pyruvyl transferase WcaK-like protein
LIFSKKINAMTVEQKNQINRQAARQKIEVSKKIGLISPFGCGNLGDVSIQKAVIQNIRKYYPDAQIEPFSLNPERVEKEIGIKGFPLCHLANVANNQWWLGNGKNSWFVTLLVKMVVGLRRSVPNHKLRRFLLAFIVPPLELQAWIKAYQNLKGLDMLMVSGGGQLDDCYGGTWYHPFTLLMWSIFAKLHQVKFAVVSVGASPIDYKLSRLFHKVVLSLASYRSYRDEDSKKYIARVVGFKKDDPVYPDLAHSLDLQEYNYSVFQTKYRAIVGIGPMGYCDPRSWPKKDSSIYMGYLNKLASFVSWLIEERYGILLFPGEAVGDLPVIKDLRDILDKNGVVYTEGQIIEEPIESIEDLMGELAKTDIAISARFHGTLLPQLLNKPVLAISHHRKVEMLMADTGQSDYCVSIDTFDVDTLKAKFLLLEKNQDLVKQQLAQRTQQYQAALDKQYEHLFKNL